MYIYIYKGISDKPKIIFKNKIITIYLYNYKLEYNYVVSLAHGDSSFNRIEKIRPILKYYYFLANAIKEHPVYKRKAYPPRF